MINISNDSSINSPKTIQVNRIKIFLIKEIKTEKWRFVFLNIISWILFIIFLTIFSLSFFLGQEIKKISFFFELWIVIPLLIFSLWLVVINGMGAYTFWQEKKIHFDYPEVVDENRIPNFIIGAYKRSYAQIIFVNWLSIFGYISITIGLIFLFLLKNKENPEFHLGSLITIQINKTFGSFTGEITIFFIVLIFLLFLHIFTYILSTRKKARLNALFDIDRKIDQNEIRKYKRKAHIICAIIFFIPLVIIFLIYWIFLRSRKKTT